MDRPNNSHVAVQLVEVVGYCFSTIGYRGIVQIYKVKIEACMTEGGTTFSCLAYLPTHITHLPVTTSSNWWLLSEHHNS